MENTKWRLFLLILSCELFLKELQSAPLPTLSGTLLRPRSRSRAQGDSSASLHGGRVKDYPLRSATLGGSSSKLGGATASIGGGSRLGSSFGHRFGRGKSGGARNSRHARRHGHSGQRHQGAAGRGRTVRIECQSVPRENLEGLLGPAFNGRYMSLEKPPMYRPVGVDTHSNPSRSRSASPGNKWTLGGTVLGDQPAASDDETLLESENSKPLHSTLPLDRGLPVGELRGKSVPLSEIGVEKQETSKLKGKPLRLRALQGDQPLQRGIILTGFDALSGLPKFAVDNTYRMDLPTETRELISDKNILEDRSSGLTVFLQNGDSEGNTDNEQVDERDSEEGDLVNSEMSDEMYLKKGGIDAPKDVPSRTKRGAKSDDAEPWKCSSEIVWEDLGEDYFPRYVRRTKCMQRGCYNTFYECREKSFTIKVLRRVSDRCVPVYGVTMKMTREGVPIMERDRILRYEQEWIFQERALPFCCECAPRFS